MAGKIERSLKCDAQQTSKDGQDEVVSNGRNGDDSGRRREVLWKEDVE